MSVDRSARSYAPSQTARSTPQELVAATLVPVPLDALPADVQPPLGVELRHALEASAPSAGKLGRLQLNALLGRTNLGIAACNAAGELTFLSPALQELLGEPFESRSELEMVNHFQLFRRDGSTPLRTEEVPMARARRGELVTDEVICARLTSGKVLYLLCTALPVRSPDETLVGAVVFVQDVTGEHAGLVAQEALHDRLLMILNHEFRTPLTRLVGYAELLHDLEGELPPEAAIFLNRIRLAAGELTALVNEVSNVAGLHASTRPSDTFRQGVAPAGVDVEERQSPAR